MVLPASEDSFDQKLVRWLARHGGPWSGTASELLAAVKIGAGVGSDSWPQSHQALYSHIDSHRQILRSLGVEAWLHDGYPRMVSLRSCQDEEPAEKPPSGTSGINRISEPPTNPSGLVYDQKSKSADFDQVSPATNGIFSQNIAPAKSAVLTERLVDGISDCEGRIFESTGEALSAIVEMYALIREHALDLKSAIDMVVGRTQEITRSCGVAIGLLHRESVVVYPARAGVAATMGEPHFQASLFQSCHKTGQALQLCDAQTHPGVGATCRREGIGSLIIVPILHNREVAGAIELLFKERGSFSAEDVMDLELIADVISERLSMSVCKEELDVLIQRSAA